MLISLKPTCSAIDIVLLFVVPVSHLELFDLSVAFDTIDRIYTFCLLMHLNITHGSYNVCWIPTDGRLQVQWSTQLTARLRPLLRNMYEHKQNKCWSRPTSYKCFSSLTASSCFSNFLRALFCSFIRKSWRFIDVNMIPAIWNTPNMNKQSINHK